MYKRKVPITRIHGNEKKTIEDEVLIEKPVDIYVNSESLVNIICLPNNLKDLAVGFLYSIGIINHLKDIENIEIDEMKYKIDIKLRKNINFDSNSLQISPVSRVVDTTCGISSPWRDSIKKTLDTKNISDEISNQTEKVKAAQIYAAIKKMQINTKLYRGTGGCHGAAAFNHKNEILSIREDIGRHNAIDKVIGDLIQKKISFHNLILTSTGRLTGDSVLKAIRAKFPILASLSAGIESGIRLAFAYGITLIGFVRGNRMNIYTHPDRIQL
ncbi:MAG: formate dehydrogenase accessory sulfurtransferase FdhD [Candidatus Lokiarchaeota archaeon]|nr:formate dehydrogenase accessory sulfurtransferase FdhD [Candidatus Lokiarchaeota archaeon]MBD3198934.1 formate dehydrogenase accessory sulfurtransferase FdhD [Candidatus Lokiarchaeota archaeon]